MNSDAFSQLFNLPGAEEIKRWEEEYRRMGEAIEEIEKKRAYLAGLIAAARGESVSPHIAKARKKDGSLRPGTWIYAIAEIAKANPEGLSYPNLRKRLPDDLRAKLKENPHCKGFYGALRRLERDEIIVRHRAHIFTPAGYKRYSDKVERGEINPVRGNDYRHSPMADTIKAYIAENGAAKATALRAHLSKMPQFSDAMRNTSAIYNVLKRLVEREELKHDAETATFALPNENEPPAEETPPSGSDAGRAATLPFDNVLGFPRAR